MPSVWVKWVDSFGGCGWTAPDCVERTLICESIGFLVVEDEHAITITTSIHTGSGQVMDPLTIPKAAILEQREIEWKD